MQKTLNKRIKNAGVLGKAERNMDLVVYRFCSGEVTFSLEPEGGRSVSFTLDNQSAKRLAEIIDVALTSNRGIPELASADC